jgi:glycosyltransferase involved in cell wall biosynthesis
VRITHVTDFFLPRLGGLELQVRDLAVRQAAAGHDVRIVTSSPSEGEHDVARGVPVVRLGERLAPQHPLHPVAWMTGSSAVLATRPDVVHCHIGLGTPLAFLAARAAAGRGVPTATTVHSFWSGYGGIIGGLERVGRWSRRPIAWTAVSDAAAEPVRRLVGVPVGVLPNGTDVQSWQVRREARRPDDVLLVAVMRLAPRKRVLPMLRLVAEARRRVPADVRLRLVVVGDGSELAAAERLVRRLGLEGVEFAGQQPRKYIHDLYARADAFLAPARLESFGIAALEARCAGVPVLALCGTGVADFVVHGRDGLLARDDQEMTDQLVRVATDPDLRERMSGHAPPPGLDWPSVLAAAESLYARAGVPEGLLPPVDQPVERTGT